MAVGRLLTFQTARWPGQTFIPVEIKAAHFAAAFGFDENNELGVINDTKSECDYCTHWSHLR